jgi:glycosyltransferase involved in cell wall biosynthesis/predicted O-methyltransferase YrrM
MTGRNEPCPCGSGKRYKACCGAVGPPRRQPQPSIVVLDDHFPDLSSGFRVGEFNALLEAFPELCVLSAARDFDASAARYFDAYPQFAGRVSRFWDQSPLREAKLAYVTFLNNAAVFLPYLEHFQLPFILQLYPGGGFGLHNPESDAKLDRVCASPLLRRVIATQTVTQAYVRERYGERVPCDLIFGAVFQASSFEFANSERSYFGMGKDRLDVCFAAFKYTDRAADKGYPEFIEAACRVAAASENVRFHVIGNLTPDDVDVTALGGRVQFHGTLVTHDLQRLFRGMDLIVSPNKPSVISPGSFDGFPTASVTEASLAGAGMVVTDPLGLNADFPDGEAAAIVQPTASDIAARILRFVEHPAELVRMAREGQRISARVYAPQRQIGARLEIIRAELARSTVGKNDVTDDFGSEPARASDLELEIARVLGSLIPADFGGGCPLDKAIRMAKLIVDHGMRRTVEIGVYRGRSFIPQALALRRTGGLVIGIDPYDAVAANEADAPERIADEIRQWTERTDFNAIFIGVQRMVAQLGLSAHARLIRATSDDALAQVEYPIDMLHVDGNHDTEFVKSDLANYVPLLRDGGFLIVDDIDWESVSVCLGDLDAHCDCIDRFDTWGIWRKRERGVTEPSSADLASARSG